MQPMEGSPAESVWTDAAAHFRAWRAGDARAVDDLVRELTPVLWHVVRAAGASEEQARDVLQTVWLGLVRNPDSVRDATAVGRWLVVSARREAWRVTKAERRATPVDPEELRTPLADAAGPEPLAGAATERSAESAALEHLDHQRLWVLVAALPPRCQRLLRVAAFIDRPDYRSLAGELGLAVGSVGSIRRRCLDTLKASLVEEGHRHA